MIEVRTLHCKDDTDMLSVAEALARITAAFAPLPGETVGLGEALGRLART